MNKHRICPTHFCRRFLKNERARIARSEQADLIAETCKTLCGVKINNANNSIKQGAQDALATQRVKTLAHAFTRSKRLNWTPPPFARRTFAGRIYAQHRRCRWYPTRLGAGTAQNRRPGASVIGVDREAATYRAGIFARSTSALSLALT